MMLILDVISNIVIEGYIMLILHDQILDRNARSALHNLVHLLYGALSNFLNFLI